MTEDDWRLLNDTEYLRNQYMDLTNGEEVVRHSKELTKCIFCWDSVENNQYQLWYLPLDKSCCICEKCFYDFEEMYHWQVLDGWDIEWPNK